jgi:hypothetical protein
MATKRPIVNYSGVLSELRNGDSLPGAAVASVGAMAIPVVETPSSCAVTVCDDWPEMVMDYNNQGRLDIVAEVV